MASRSAALAQFNGLSSSAKLRAGRSLLVPPGQSLTVAAAAAAGPPSPPSLGGRAAGGSDAHGCLCRAPWRFDREIAKKTGLKEAELLKINQLKNPNYIYEGQKLQIAAVTLPAVPSQPSAAVATAATRPSTAAVTPSTVPSKPIVVASARARWRAGCRSAA